MKELVVKFDMTNEDDKYQFKMIEDGWKYKYVLNEIDEYLRQQIKYQDKWPDTAIVALQEIRDLLYEKLHDMEINLDD